MNVAIIPARAGSKRIIGKNIREFCGKPIIAYSIETALKTGIFDKVIVSTDSEKIASVAKDYGAEVPFLRPKEFSDDFTGTNQVIKHAIITLKDQGINAEFACCIYATAPLLQTSYLIDGYEKLCASRKLYSFSVTSYSFPIQRALRLNHQGCVEPVSPQYRETRSQDLEEAYHDAGQFYWGRCSSFLDDEVTYAPSSIAILIPPYLVQDIDTLEDWKKAELMYQCLLMENNKE